MTYVYYVVSDCESFSKQIHFISKIEISRCTIEKIVMVYKENIYVVFERGSE